MQHIENSKLEKSQDEALIDDESSYGQIKSISLDASLFVACVGHKLCLI